MIAHREIPRCKILKKKRTAATPEHQRVFSNRSKVFNVIGAVSIAVYLQLGGSANKCWKLCVYICMGGWVDWAGGFCVGDVVSHRIILDVFFSFYRFTRFHISFSTDWGKLSARYRVSAGLQFFRCQLSPRTFAVHVNSTRELNTVTEIKSTLARL